TGRHERALLRRESADILIGVVHALFGHHGRHRGHGGLLEQTGYHLRSDCVARIVQQLDRAVVLVGAEGNWISAEAGRNDEGHRRIARLDGCFSGRCRVVCRCRCGFALRCRSGKDQQRRFALQSLDELTRCLALVFIHQDHLDLGCGIMLAAEDDREDAEERDRQNKAEHESAAITAQCNECGSSNRENQSRNSLPVRWRNTDSRLGRRSETSTSSKPALLASSSRAAISDECSMVNSAVASASRPRWRAVHALIASGAPAKRACTCVRVPNAL